MRNYYGYNRLDTRAGRYGNEQNRKDEIMHERTEGRSKVVIDESTIYEIDMDCYECMHKKYDAWK